MSQELGLVARRQQGLLDGLHHQVRLILVDEMARVLGNRVLHVVRLAGQIRLPRLPDRFNGRMIR